VIIDRLLVEVLMNTANYYYLVSSLNAWVLHKKGCEQVTAAKFRVFLGSIYTDFQASGIAQQRVPEFSLCEDCMDS
jgi:hypothetical protein